MSVLNNFKIRKANLKWRRNNAHNSTYMRNNFDISRVKVGNCTYGGLYILMHNHYRHVSIGHFCSIAPEVSFIDETFRRLRHSHGIRRSIHSPPVQRHRRS